MMSRRTGAPVVAALAVLVLAGCPNPKQKFDDFVGRVPPRDMARPPAGDGGMQFDVSGTFLLAISTTIAPDAPLQFIATTTMTPGGDGSATLDIAIEPLATKDRMIVPGAKAEKKGNPVDASGKLTVDFGGPQTVPGAANPISGSDIVATLQLKGQTRSKDLFCGDVTGMATQPIMLDLAGSTFGAIRVAPGTIGMNLPMPVGACPKEGVDMGVPADLVMPAADMASPSADM